MKPSRHASREKHRGTLPQPPLRAAEHPYVLGVLLAIAVAAVYLQSLRFDFVLLDDPVYAGGNTHVQGGLTWQNLKWSFTQFHDANWIPLTWLSLMLDSQLYGIRPGGYHFTNVLMHAVNTVLLFAVFAAATGKNVRSAFVAGLFGLHPLHVESVAWIAERKDVLSTLFGFLSLLAYVYYAQKGRVRYLAVSWFCLALSLMSKQTFVTLPFVFLLMDFWPLGRFARDPLRAGIANQPTAAADNPPATSDTPAKSDATAATLDGREGRRVRRGIGRLILEKLPFFALSAVFCVIAVLAQSSEQEALASLARYSLATRCMNAVLVYATYLRKTVAPYDLAVYYPHPGSALTWNAVLAAAAVLLAISGAAVFWMRKFPFLFVGWAWYLGTLVPMIGIVQVGGQQMADRYTYFPLVGLFVAVAWLIPALVPAALVGRRALPVTAVAILCLLAAVTYLQLGFWRDSVTLYGRALACAPGDPFSQSSLGYALVLNNQPDEGLALLEQAVHTPPPSSKTHFGLAMALQKLRRNDEAAREYEAALRLDDRDPEAHNNLAVILCGRRQYDEAKRHLLRAIEVQPNYAESYVNLGVLCVVTRNYADAIAYSQRALDLDPTIRACRYTLALALRSEGRLNDAADQYRNLVASDPEDRQARLELERTLAMKRRLERR